MEMIRKRIAITGAAGTIGKVLQKGLKGFYQLTLLDIVPIEGEDSIVIDVANEYSRLKEVLAGHDVVIHLARDIRGGFKSGDNWVPENDEMVWNTLKASVEVGVKRVIMASSIHASDYSNWRGPELISPDNLPNPDTPYGAMKISMEAMGRYFARKRGLEIVCLRLGGVNPDDVPFLADEPDYYKIWLSHRDCTDLVRKCIEAKSILQIFTIIFGVSNNTRRIHDFKNPVEWIPQDNTELKGVKGDEKMYRVLREERIPVKTRHIIWDVNGTITRGDIPDREVLKSILALAQKGVDHSFITGRDRRWLEKMLINPLGELEGFEKLAGNLHFYPELGLIKLDPVSRRIEVTDMLKNHPLTDSSVRQRIAGLFYQTKNLIPYQGKEKQGYFVGGDADANFFLISETPAVEFPYFFWSDSKELIGTAEVIRNLDTSFNKECAANINKSAERLERVFSDWGLGDSIKVSPVSTALNLVPIVGGLPLDKDMAAGIALYNLAQKLQMSIHEICSQTIAIGDGTADLLFTTPILGLIPLFFVGPRSQLRPTALQERQITLLAEGAIEEGKETGPEVTREVLHFIEGRIPPKRDVIYLRGKDNLEEFEGTERLTRGIERRIRHFIPEEDIHVHDAFLDPSLQEGHIHSDGYEAIMLEEGDIDALVWAGEKIQIYPLREWGDMIIFLPGAQHTLLVKKRSRIIVAKAHMVAFAKDQRKKIDLPAGMETLRQEMLEGKKEVELVLTEAKARL